MFRTDLNYIFLCRGVASEKALFYIYSFKKNTYNLNKLLDYEQVFIRINWQKVHDEYNGVVPVGIYRCPLGPQPVTDF
jgi:hypothetical protein